MLFFVGLSFPFVNIFIEQPIKFVSIIIVVTKVNNVSSHYRYQDSNKKTELFFH